MNCGHYCGANSLIGRGNKEDNFGYWFDYDIASQCAIEFDHDKKMWIARRFFSKKSIDLPFTQGISDSIAMLKYEVEFTNNGQLLITDFIERTSFTSPNPCSDF